MSRRNWRVLLWTLSARAVMMIKLFLLGERCVTSKKRLRGRLIHFTLAGFSDQTVMDEFEPVGCFKDKGNPRALPVLLKSFQKLINWNKPTTSFMAVIRACAAVAQNHGFRYFGVQDYKECWSGKNGDLSYNRHGISYDCQGLAHGVGKAWTNFVYRFKRGAFPIVSLAAVLSGHATLLPSCWGGVLGDEKKPLWGRLRFQLLLLKIYYMDWAEVTCIKIVSYVYFDNWFIVNGEWSQWFPWQPCSVTCGTGNRSRVRTCTEPAPKWGGQNCIGINMSINACSERKCAGNEMPWSVSIQRVYRAFSHNVVTAVILVSKQCTCDHVDVLRKSYGGLDTFLMY